MGEDRFRPPSSHVEDPRRGKGSAVKGVVLGLLADLGGTMLFGIVVSIAYGIALTAAGRSAEEVGSFLAQPEGDPLLSAILIGGGVLSSVLGGFVCERIARQGTYKLAVVLSALSLAAGFAMGMPAYSWAMQALLIFLTVGSIFLGTRLAFQDAAVRVEP